MALTKYFFYYENTFPEIDPTWVNNLSVKFIKDGLKIQDHMLFCRCSVHIINDHKKIIDYLVALEQTGKIFGLKRTQ